MENFVCIYKNNNLLIEVNFCRSGLQVKVSELNDAPLKACDWNENYHYFFC